MKDLIKKLLESDELYEIDMDSSLKGSNSLGTYNPMQFVLRLRDDIQRALDSDENTSERVQAFSTFLHETIHWWQHVGSNIGFITSLSYPVLSHLSHRDLSTLIEKGIKYKSIRRFDEMHFQKFNKHDIPEVNRILNNWHDIMYAKYFILDNKLIHEIVKDRRFYLSLGHSFHILWLTAINTLSASVDRKLDFLPQINNWSDQFGKLEKEKVDGFAIDSGSIPISNIGTRAIFEGQARFNQLQYLSIAANNELTYVDFHNLGMLSGIYVEAFNLYLQVTKIERPLTLNNSIIGLFLLLCDIAINPTDGFPIDINYFETFIISNDPGIRFTTLCMVVKKDSEKWINAIKDYSRKEYIELSEELSKAIACIPPLWGSATVMNWVDENESLKTLLEEESKMKFKLENLPIRLFFSKYIRFQEDKSKYPNVFCWTGKSMTSELHNEFTLEQVEKLFYKHQALFVDNGDGEIQPSTFEGIDKENIMESFNLFYTYNTTYDMTMKWVNEKGEFSFDYSWLTPNQTEEDVTKWIRNNFKDAYGIFPEELEII